MTTTLRFWLAALFIALAGNATATIQTVTVANFSFSPASFTIALGDTVQWVWSNGSHTTTSGTIPSGAATWNSSMTSSTTTFTYIPTVSGTYNYVCTPHAPNMAGTFVVSGCTPPSTPAITSSNGSSACVGSTTPIMLSTSAQAGGTYQWFNGTTAVTGATASSLNVATTTANAGSYTVKVTRCSTTATSAAFPVTMNALPVPAFTETHSGLTYNFTNTTPSSASNTYVWTFSDGSPNQTTTNATRTFAAVGSYTVTLKATTTATGCSATSSPLTIQAKLGVGTLAGASYSVLPNPAASFISINAPEGAAFHLTDMSGRAVNAPTATLGKASRMDVSGVPAGLYLLRISYGGAIVTEQVSILH